MRASSISILATGLVTGLALGACANDPVYIPAPLRLEAGQPGEMNDLTEAKATLQLPIKLETEADLTKRAALAIALGVDVPYVRVGDLEIDVEWTIRNLDNRTADARVLLNGANEYHIYDPSIIILDPDEEDALPAPSLGGDVPIEVPAGGSVSGLFTEDDLREAAIDLDQITRGNVSPYRAALTISKNAKTFQPVAPAMMDDEGGYMFSQTPVGDPIPRDAFAGITRVDLVFRPEAHMVLEYNVRIRDLRGIMHSLLLAAETDKPDELQAFTPAIYNPTPTGAPPPAAR